MINKLFKSAVFTVLLFAGLVLTVAFFLMKGIITEEYLYICRTAIFIICGFTAGAAAALIFSFRGIIAGIAGGTTFALLLIAASSVFLKEKTPDLVYTVMIIAGGSGGIIGANIKK